MFIIANLLLFGALSLLCLRGYLLRRAWLARMAGFMRRLGHGRSLLAQYVRVGPVIVGWLLACHWLNTHGWHGPAAAGIVLAMCVGLQLMRDWEEQQKRRRALVAQGISRRQG